MMVDNGEADNQQVINYILDKGKPKSLQVILFVNTEHKRMHVPSKVLLAFQFLSSLLVVCVVGHAGSLGDAAGFSASPTAMALLQLSAANLFFTFFVLAAALSSEKIYETPLICFHGLLFFFLLMGIGITSIINSIGFETLQEKEIGIAGVITVISAITSIAGCCFSYNICENLKTF